MADDQTQEEPQNGFHRVNPFVPPEGIGMHQMLTSPMGEGERSTLYDAATRVSPSLRDGWPLIGGGTKDDMQWAGRIYATSHYWRLGAKPDLERMAWLRWMMTPGVDSERTKQLINAYAFGTSPAVERERIEKGKEKQLTR